MSENSRVVWSEGMFLRPQHFQQHDRYIENWVNGRCAGLRAFAWGFRALQLDHGQLGIGKLALLESRGIFQDGTPFDMPDDDEPPLALDVPQDTRNSVVYLALPVRRPDSAEIDSDKLPDSLSRYRLGEREVRDNIHGSDGRYPVQVGKLRTRLMLAGQERTGYHCLGLARVVEVRSNNTVVLDEKFIPPILTCEATSVMASYLNELHGLLHVRGETLSDRVVEAGRGGMRETLNFLLLQTINRYELLLEHMSASLMAHPEEFYMLSLQLLGELSTFYRQEKRPAKPPKYDHDNLGWTIENLMVELRKLLGKVLPENAIKIPLYGPKFGVYGAKPEDYVNLMNQAVFVLAVKADMPPEELQPVFPPQVKIWPLKDIPHRIRSAVTGVSIHLMSVAPEQIRSRPEFSYFRLNKQSEFWKDIADPQGLGIYVGGNFPNMELELWAIKAEADQ